MTMSNDLIQLVERYTAAKSLSESHVAKMAYNSGTFFARVRGGGGFTNHTYERVLRWFSEHWPEDVEWPNDIERPITSTHAAE